ncbi:DNA cytosine methyltransferase [Rhodobacter capsulatus]|uniref:DNA cytosine methyltransferase n=1 Tax=Rhodobacter capsulatus TaxID=1061 RepID=UPI0040274C34
MKVVDLFCGTGGFGLGARNAGFEVPLSIDLDPILTSSHKWNFPSGKLKLADISLIEGAAIVEAAGGVVDGLIGGPPCQGFSLMGKRQTDDPRRNLVDHFFRLVAEVEPTFFVMENVVGLVQGEASEVLASAMNRLPTEYAVTGPMILDAADFGVPTSRKRCFVIGIRRGRGDVAALRIVSSAPKSTVEDAISDLQHVRSMRIDDRGFDFGETGPDVAVSAYAKALRMINGQSTGHRRTAHTEAVLQRFERVPQGKTDPVGRHQRLSWKGICPTLRAGTGADRGSFQSVRPIHPAQPRVITVREAARLQGFPDWHLFHPTVWHSFRMIGNSVSPPVAAAVLKAIGRICGFEAMPTLAAE